MRSLISLVLSLSLILTFCAPANATAQTSAARFRSLSDPSIPPYIEDTLYQTLISKLDSEDYFIENVSAVYISQEYLDELAFNSRSNVFFGYTLASLEAQFQGNKYVFTLGENNETVVEPWVDYDDPFEKVIQNVAIGTGVILVCVTVSIVTAGTGAAACSMIFAVAAKGSAIGALSGAALGGVSAGIIKCVQTGNLNQALDAAILAGSEGYKWGAITGAISGGASEALALKGATLNGLTMNEAALIQRESGYPLSIIKEFHSLGEYQVYREAGLFPHMVNNKTALIRNIDFAQKDAYGRTNLERMLSGEAPLDPRGVSYELHHVGQKNDSVFAILTQSEHRGQGNFSRLHENLISSPVDHGVAFEKAKRDFWKDLGNTILTEDSYDYFHH